MGLKDILEQHPKLTIDALQEFQREYDRRFVDDGFTGFDKVRHTNSHMGTLLGRLSKYVQMIEDRNHDFSPGEVKTKVIPDLLVYAGWLASEFDVNIEEAYLRRIVSNIQEKHKEEISPEELQELEDYINKRLQKE